MPARECVRKAVEEGEERERKRERGEGEEGEGEKEWRERVLRLERSVPWVEHLMDIEKEKGKEGKVCDAHCDCFAFRIYFYNFALLLSFNSLFHTLPSTSMSSIQTPVPSNASKLSLSARAPSLHGCLFLQSGEDFVMRSSPKRVGLRGVCLCTRQGS